MKNNLRILLITIAALSFQSLTQATTQQDFTQAYQKAYAKTAVPAQQAENKQNLVRIYQGLSAADKGAVDKFLAARNSSIAKISSNSAPASAAPTRSIGATSAGSESHSVTTTTRSASIAPGQAPQLSDEELTEPAPMPAMPQPQPKPAMAKAPIAIPQTGALTAEQRKELIRRARADKDRADIFQKAEDRYKAIAQEMNSIKKCKDKPLTKKEQASLAKLQTFLAQKRAELKNEQSDIDWRLTEKQRKEYNQAMKDEIDQLTEALAKMRAENDLSEVADAALLRMKADRQARQIKYDSETDSTAAGSAGGAVAEEPFRRFPISPGTPPSTRYQDKRPAGLAVPTSPSNAPITIDGKESSEAAAN